MVYTTDLKSVEQLFMRVRLPPPAPNNIIMYNPLPPDVIIRKSMIHGFGLFATEDIPADTNLGITHYWLEGKLIRTPLGGFYNHSEDPSCRSKIVNPDWKVKRACLVTLRDIKAGEEITTTYKIQPL